MDNNLIATWQCNNLSHLDPSDFNRPVYRFMKYKHLLSMINDSELKIAKISSWGDTYENFFWKSNFKLQDGVCSFMLTKLENLLYMISNLLRYK
jgi:hypothetical protein